MKVPIEWLKELVKFKFGPDQLAKMLTMGGLETMVEPGNILEIDIIPNRSDCWSIRGIAREVAALTKGRVTSNAIRVKEITKKASSVVKVEVKDKELCPRYMARVIENVTIKESPKWLKDRLEKAGIRSINNIVDVTNYLLLELGQPMHAFDAGFVADQTIIVRRAKPNEKITTLDGQEHELKTDMLVIADTEKAVALGGVMGGANSEVNEDTKTIILESAYFDPVSIHKTSKLLKVRSESSIRFEHGVDWKTVEEAVDRGAAMIAELSGGSVLKGKIDKKTKERQPKVVALRPERVNKVLGTDLTKAEMLGILKRLGFGVLGSKVSIPLFRAEDIYREIDLIEEIARVNGYDKIEATMPNTAFPGKSVDNEDIFRSKVREIMAGCGLLEAQTYSMVGPKDFEKTGLDYTKAIKVANPMNIEEGYMRTMIIPSLLNVIQHNLNRQMENVFIFEIGKTYFPSSEKLPKEKWILSAAATGSPFMSALDKGQVDYSFMKGILENLFSALGVTDYSFVEVNSHLLQPGRGARVEGLGIIGELHPDISKNYGFEKPVGFFEIILDELFLRAAKRRKYRSLPKFPAVSRDIAMFVPKGLENQLIVSTIKKIGGRLVERIYLFDKYKDSLAYRIVYRNPDKTLTDSEVNAKHEEILKTIESKLGVRIRR
ncbi:MAG: phenylalanine--tRNA ligase subunit beta [Candidatus Margulisiibacteriota bacterium]